MHLNRSHTGGSEIEVSQILPSRSSVSDSISGHDNNYTLIRVFLAASVIYFHAFGMTAGPVLQDHLSNTLLPITSVGGLAVEAFFFLSGLFVTQSFFKDRNILGFAAKRFLRIWPGLFVCLLVSAFLICAITNPHNIPRIFVFSGFYDYVLKNAAFDITYVIPDTIEGLPFPSINGSIHTLPLEAKMYVVLGFLGLIGLVSRRWLIMVASAVTMLVTLIPVHGIPVLSWVFPSTYSHVAYTMFFAGVFTFGVAKWIVPRLWHGVALGLLMLVLHDRLHVIAFYLFVIWSILFIGGWSKLGSFIRPRQDLSYGIYIYGWPSAQLLLLTAGPRISPYLLALLALCLASAFAAVSWRFVEKPAIAFGHRLATTIGRGRSGSGPKETRSGAFDVRIIFALSLVLVACVLARYVVYLHPFVPVVEMSARIKAFGPDQAKAGVPLNVQPDGTSAMWIALDSMPEQGATVVFSNQRLVTATGTNLVTATVDNSLVGHAGDKPIYVERRLMSRIERSNVVLMHVSP
ncbi:Peptidoglycan/LPS O-acetylase OafA/YrhL, contains acyltransferase and SGNH-hydrolase domains [Burkholderia sp. CF099]|nr:Peptidoglycan/LPS O-acetylase OafA/YrhL, contains acyltransferase and SGNH-hydrolase domains [Burkholderia sp. CF099]